MFRRDFLMLPMLAGASVAPSLTLAADQSRAAAPDAASALNRLFTQE